MMGVGEGANGSDHRLSPDQVKGLFRKVALEHLQRLERAAQFDRLQPGFTVTASRRSDVIMGHVYRLLAAGGPEVTIDDVNKAGLLEAGMSNHEIAEVAVMLDGLRRNNMVRDSRPRLEALLAGVGGTTSAINLGLAQTIKYRAMAAALFDTRHRWDGDAGDAAALLESFTRQQAVTLPAQEAGPAVAASEPSTAPTPVRTEAPAVSSRPTPSETAHQVNDDIVAQAERLVEGRLRNVDPKTQRQVVAAARFFAKYVREVHGVDGLRGLQQNHLAGFVHLLQSEIYVHHGKSERDEGRTIAELRKEWAKKPKQFIGVDKPTADRWTQQLAQVFDGARSAGVRFDAALTFKGLVVSKARPKRARDARPTMQPVQSGALFRQPPFTGCKAWNAICEPGPCVFHGAIYFATMLIQYGGGRREEICGAMTKDVQTALGIVPHIQLVDNKYRRLKNAQSERPVIIHPELIRLGFLDYVAEVEALGYELLFPDLYSPTTQSPLGDRFHDQLRPVLDLAGITAKGTGSHSARRGFGNSLKQERVGAEERAELLGHGGKTETTERYCGGYDLQILQGAILKLPVVTGHLEPMPINLLPWIATKKTAPFSHPGRTKAAKQARRKPR